jgi:hypothetical protein
MPTTSGHVARLCLAGLREAGVQFAVLHDYARLESDRISDVDVVVGQDPRTVIRATERIWRASGLLPIILWPYDIGGTATLFIATSDAIEGVQLDMMYDPAGIGRYRVRSDILLQFVEERPLAPVVDDAARVIYLWQKRTAKTQSERLEQLRRDAREIETSHLEDLSRVLTGSADPARGLMGGQVGVVRRPWAVLARLSRVITRLRGPIGAWVHVTTEAIGEELARRLAGHLVIVRSSQLPVRSRQVMWYLRQVATVRYRPGVYISFGSQSGFVLRPDIEIAVGDPDAAASALTEFLRQRTLKCVS